MKNEVNKNELENVDGGQMPAEVATITCPKCGNVMYDYGSYEKHEKISCGCFKYYYTCSKCNHEWSEIKK